MEGLSRFDNYIKGFFGESEHNEMEKAYKLKPKKSWLSKTKELVYKKLTKSKIFRE